LRHRHPPRPPSAAQGLGPRLHQPRRVGDEPAGRGARHAGTTEGAWRVDDALRVAPGALGPVGVLLLRRPAGPSGRSERGRGLGRATRRVLVLQSVGHLSARRALTDRLMFNQLGVIGCGLMGGSFALALKRGGLVKRVVGYSKSPSTTERAKKLGVIDDSAESALLAVSGSDIVLLAVPVAATEATFKAIRHLVEPGVLFMDVGSTKRDVVDAARRVLKERVASFVPAHPIAGKEVAGIAHADATLYNGRQVILTPLAQTNPELVQKATDVWAGIGAQVLRMTPENHDAAFAAVSHLPHMLAFAYFNSVARQPAGRDFL